MPIIRVQNEHMVVILQWLKIEAVEEVEQQVLDLRRHHEKLIPTLTVTSAVFVFVHMKKMWMKKLV